jgi:hypothetical protein
MPKLLRRSKPTTDDAAPDDAAAHPPEAVADDVAEPHMQPEQPEQQLAQTDTPPDVPAAAVRSDPAPGGNGGASRTSGGLLARMDPGALSRAERDRQAALEFEQAVAPVMDLLAASVPEASSPEEAARAWESRAGEALPDPAGGAYVPGDSYDNEARVYYRLLRRDYQKNPRPSLVASRGVSHHLHNRYNRFPGTKGW